MKPTKPAIIYARFSPRPDAEEAASIEFQNDLCRTWAEQNGYRVEAYFSDEGLSGGLPVDQRPGLREAMSRLKSGGVLLVYRWDRLARSVLTQCVAEKMVNDRKASIISVSESDSTENRDPEKVLIRHVMSALNEYSRASNAQRTSDAMLSYQRTGRRMTRPDRLPYGYKSDPDDQTKMVEDAAEQRTIKSILDMADAELTPKQICEGLTQNRIYTRNGEYWTSRAVERILKRHQSTVK